MLDKESIHVNKRWQSLVIYKGSSNAVRLLAPKAEKTLIAKQARKKGDPSLDGDYELTLCLIDCDDGLIIDKLPGSVLKIFKS